jgi:hypothetical protein
MQGFEYWLVGVYVGIIHAWRTGKNILNQLRITSHGDSRCLFLKNFMLKFNELHASKEIRNFF